MQQKVRDLAPAPVSVVWIERAGTTMSDIAAEFKTIRATGFTALKQLIFRTDLAMDPIAAQQKQQAVFNLALDSGDCATKANEGGGG